MTKNKTRIKQGRTFDDCVGILSTGPLQENNKTNIVKQDTVATNSSIG